MGEWNHILNERFWVLTLASPLEQNKQCNVHWKAHRHRNQTALSLHSPFSVASSDFKHSP